MDVEIRTLRPEHASAMLSASTTRNRSIHDQLVERYQKEMQAGQWIENGQTITITKLGDIVDGHHRLRALSKCEGVSIRVPVVVVDHPQAMLTVDIGRPRNVPDMFEMQFGINGVAGKIAVQIINAMFKNNGYQRNVGMSSVCRRVLEVYRENERGIAWAMEKGWGLSIHDSNRARIRNTIRNGAAAPEFLWACLAAIYQRCPDLAVGILDDISADNPSPSELGVAMIRVMLWNFNNPGKKKRLDWTRARYIIACNHYIRGTSAMRINHTGIGVPAFRLDLIESIWGDDA